jgi:cell division protein FtsQ
VLFFEVLMAVFTSPILGVKRVHVVGLRTLKSQDIISTARVPLQKNIFLIGLKKITRRTASHPVVDRAHVAVSLPNTVVIRIQERKPVLILQHGSQFFEVDTKKVPYRSCPSPLRGLPILQAADIRSISLGKPMPNHSIDVAFQCLGRPDVLSVRDIYRISVDQNGNLCLNIRDGIEVRLGQPDSKFAEKFNLLKNIKTTASNDYRRALYFDLSCPEAPAVKYKEDTPEQANQT